MILRGRVLRFGGSWSSGIGYLEVECVNGEVSLVSCENGPTVRALQDCFGDVVQDGHCVHIPKHARDTELLMRLDSLGILASFVPYGEWIANGGPEIPASITESELKKKLGYDITI